MLDLHHSGSGTTWLCVGGTSSDPGKNYVAGREAYRDAEEREASHLVMITGHANCPVARLKSA